ncbi:hypothetical protein EMCRGX_G033736 [Ephydatia muelleri]
MLAASSHYGVSGALLCKPDPSLPGCICKGENFILDISRILPYPYSISDSTRTQLNYSFSPCKPIQCANSPKGSAVCQYFLGTYEYNCGLTANWTVYSTNPQNFSVVYSLGTSNRQTTVSFYQDKNATTNSASSVIEYPTLYYAFSVRFNINASPQDFETSIAFPVGLALGLLAGLVASTSALLLIFIVRKRRSGLRRQMDLGTSTRCSTSNSIEKIKDCTLSSVKNEAYVPTVHIGESSHVKLSEPRGVPPAIAIKPNVAYGVINKEESAQTGSYVEEPVMVEGYHIPQGKQPRDVRHEKNERDAGLMKALAQEATADDRFPS